MVADVGGSADSRLIARERTASLRVISADSHVTEPADLWCHGLDRKFREHAPRVVRDYGRDRYLFVAPGISRRLTRIK